MGATITNNKTKRSAITDAAGVVNIDVNIGDVFDISFIGYNKRSVTIKDNAAFVTVVMQAADSKLDEVQVIAYGTTSRRFSTGNVVSVSGEEIKKVPVMNPILALQGKVPGMIITPTSGNASAPVKIEIRGRGSVNLSASSEPLIVVDGLPQSTLNFAYSNTNPLVESGPSSVSLAGASQVHGGQSPLFNLNPADIESIDVLLDGDATAIYGSRGANGVILITTRRGRPGKTQMNLSVQQGWVVPPSRYPRMMNIQEYVAMRKEAMKNEGLTPTAANAPDLAVWDTTRNIDWVKEILGTGNNTNLSASISGGDQNSNFSLGTSYETQKDLYQRKGGNDRGTLSFNFNHTGFNRKFKMGLSVNYGISKVDAVSDRATNIFNLPPNAPPIFTPDGRLNYADWNAVGLAARYPFSYILNKSIAQTNTMGGSLRIQYEIIKGLSFSTNAGYGDNNNSTDWYSPIAAKNPYARGAAPTGSMQLGTTRSKNYTVEPQLSYNRMVGKGNLGILVGGSMQRNVVNTLNATATGFTSDEMLSSINNVPSANRSVSTNFVEYKYAAVFGRLSYNWENKYVMNINFRRDGSSKFAPGKQFGNFGSLGLAWLASEEAWLKKALPEWMSFVKLRGSYAIIGGDGVGDYEYLSQWSTIVEGSTIPGYDGLQPSIPIHAVNQVYHWADERPLEAALELGFLDDKITFNLSWYNRRTGNQLIQLPTPIHTGFPQVAANSVALVENSGIAAAVTANLIRSKDMLLSVNVNIGVNRNRLLEYPGLEFSPFARAYRIGKPLNLDYVYKYIGVDPLSGLYAFEDYNKDGVLTSNNSAIPGTGGDDRYIVIDRTPKYAGGLTANFGYKGITLSIACDYMNSLGNNPFANVSTTALRNMIYSKELIDNHWQKPGDIAKYGRYVHSSTFTFSASDRAYVNNFYFRFNSLALGYGLPEKLVKKGGMQACRVSLNVSNIFSFNRYGFDPQMGTNLSYVPTPRVVVGRVNFTF